MQLEEEVLLRWKMMRSEVWNILFDSFQLKSFVLLTSIDWKLNDWKAKMFCIFFYPSFEFAFQGSEAALLNFSFVMFCFCTTKICYILSWTSSYKMFLIMTLHKHSVVNMPLIFWLCGNHSPSETALFNIQKRYFSVGRILWMCGNLL